jgi:acyl-CoA thioesterase
MLVPTSINGRERRGFTSASSGVADGLRVRGGREVSVETALSPDALARACADAMWQDDRASQGLGMTIVEIGPGRAALQMTVQPHMVNGHGIAHGGFIFTLADSAFAFACNSHNDRTVAAQGSISFIRPGKLGDVLVARATEVSRSGRSGIYDVRVTAGDTVIAEFRGHSRSIGGTLVPIPVAPPEDLTR